MIDIRLSPSLLRYIMERLTNQQSWKGQFHRLCQDNGQMTLLVNSYTNQPKVRLVFAQAHGEIFFHLTPRLNQTLCHKLDDNSCHIWFTPRGEWLGYYQGGSIATFRLPAQPVHHLSFGLYRRYPKYLKKAPQIYQQNLPHVTTLAISKNDSKPLSEILFQYEKPQQLLKNQRYFLIGSGQMSMAMCEHLAKFFPKKITLMVEQHGLDFIGKKIATIKATTATEIALLPCSSTNSRIQQELIQHDIIISATNNTEARLRSSLYATGMHKIHLDITSQFEYNRKERLIGADIRLIIPQEQRCLACFGGLTVNKPPKHGLLTAPFWQLSKTSSIAPVAYAMQLLAEHATATQPHSRWLRLRHKGISEITDKYDKYCPICAIAGYGLLPNHYLSAMAKAVADRSEQIGTI